VEEKLLKAKVVNKHELERDWNASSYVPRVGETVYYDPEIDDNGNPDVTKCPREYRTKPEIRTRIKNGDGVHCVKDLPFGSESILTGGDGEGSIIQIDNKAYGERSIALGNNSAALSQNSVTFGENTIAGAKGINIISNTTIQKGTSITELRLKSVYGLETTDIITIIDSYGYWYINYAKILEIDETEKAIKICPLDGRAEFKDTDFRMNVDNDRTLKYVIPTKSMTNKTQITEAYGGESAGRIYLYNSSLDNTWSNRDIIVEVSGEYYYTRAENLVYSDTGGWRGLYIPNTNIDISEPTNIWIYKASYDPEKLLLGSVEFGEGACSRGKNSTSLGNYTTAIGEETEAAGFLAFAGGYMAKANGNGAFSFGHGTYA
jgi:hypothetical protein